MKHSDVTVSNSNLNVATGDIHLDLSVAKDEIDYCEDIPMLDISCDKNHIKHHSNSLNTSLSDDKQLLQSVLKFEMEHGLSESISILVECTDGELLTCAALIEKFENAKVSVDELQRATVHSGAGDAH
ncbi:unnamed protein product [Didymodactylos carnosus]|nr:unnamed protein product [Didymodactylos carnosus]CAF3580152.1 unnamed protein product [Didymodactylos carnosus]